jgi:uncharacterized protein YbjT (DUF2867 family)
MCVDLTPWCLDFWQRGYKVRALSRNKDKAQKLFGVTKPELEIVAADARDPSTLTAVMKGVAAVCCSTGTTAFPSTR